MLESVVKAYNEAISETDKAAAKVRQILRERGLEGRIQLAVGGAPYRFGNALRQAVGADGWAADGIGAGKLIVGLIKAARRGNPP